MKKALFVIVPALLLVAGIILFKRYQPSVKQSALSLKMKTAVLEDQDLDEIKRILAAGFDVESPIGPGTFNCVDGAVEVGDVEMLKLFLAKGAQPKSSALIPALRGHQPACSIPMVTALLEAGANAGHKEYYPTNRVTADTQKPDPGRFTSPLHVASYDDNYEAVELLLNHSGVELNGLDIDGRTPLMSAAECGHERVVKLLLAKGARVDVANGRGETALTIARSKWGVRDELTQLLANAQPVNRIK